MPDKPKATGPAVIDWVFYHLPPERGLSPAENARLMEALKTAPEGAAGLLDEARKDRQWFYQNLWSKRIAEQQIKSEAKVSDNGEPVLQLIEKLQAALEPVPMPQGADGPEGQPGVPQADIEVSPDQL